MLTAQQTSVWGRSYQIAMNGAAVTTFSPKRWGNGGQFSLDGSDYELRSNVWGHHYVLTDVGRNVAVATAEKVGHKNWTVESGGQTYRFQRVSIWKSDQALLADGRQVGVIKRTSVWRLNAQADLPGVPVPVQVFVLAVVLTMWRSQAAAGAAASAG